MAHAMTLTMAPIASVSIESIVARLPPYGRYGNYRHSYCAAFALAAVTSMWVATSIDPNFPKIGDA